MTCLARIMRFNIQFNRHSIKHSTVPLSLSLSLLLEYILYIIKYYINRVLLSCRSKETMILVRDFHMLYSTDII